MVARKRKTKKELEDQRREKKECLEALQSAQVARGETGAVQTAEYCEFMEKVVKASAAKQIQQVDAAKLTGVNQSAISRHVSSFKRYGDRLHYQAEPQRAPSLTSEALAKMLHHVDNAKLTRNAVSTEGFGLLIAGAVHESRAATGKAPLPANWTPSESFKRDLMERCDLNEQTAQVDNARRKNAIMAPRNLVSNYAVKKALLAPANNGNLVSFMWVCACEWCLGVLTLVLSCSICSVCRGQASLPRAVFQLRQHSDAPWRKKQSGSA